MTIWKLVIREAGFRKLNFGLSLLAVAVAVGTTVAALTMLEAHDLRRENEALKKRLAVLESREIGVSFNRVIEILQGGEYMGFDTIVQKLIDSEMEATYGTLTELATKYVVECDPSGKRWRVRS